MNSNRAIGFLFLDSVAALTPLVHFAECCICLDCSAEETRGSFRMRCAFSRAAARTSFMWLMVSKKRFLCRARRIFWVCGIGRPRWVVFLILLGGGGFISLPLPISRNFRWKKRGFQGRGPELFPE